jgi:hypothetical protein
MISVFAIALLLALAGWAARLWVLAQRAEHLVVLRLDRGTFYLGRQPDGRLGVMSPVRIPGVLAQYEVIRTVERYQDLRAGVSRLTRPRRLHRAPAHLH